MTARMRLLISVMAVVAVVLVGAAGYMTIDVDRGVTFFDAVYMTIITVSTVGHESVWELSRPGQLWTMTIITFGVVTVSYAFTSLLTLVVSGELRSLRERRKMEKQIEHIHNHVILCGYGRMGSLIAGELESSRVPMVVIERNRELDGDLRGLRFPFVLGDATDEDTLIQAGLMRARALVIALPTDADSVYVTLTARTLNPNVMIIARAEQPSTEAKLKRAGATRVICPQVIGATKVANILTRPSVVDFVDVANKGVDLEIDEYDVPEGSPLVGRTLRESHIRRRTGAIVVAIKRADGEAMVGPDPDAVLEARDTLILVGSAGMSERLPEIEGS